MSKVLNEEDKLAFILTQYGLNRIAEAIADATVEINLSKIKIGDANLEYYSPNENQEELVHPIPDGSFYIIEKELLEDNLTVSLYTIFPESLQNCEIREIGIYETVDGEDKLFAVSTQQPLLKPLESLRYFISVDYYAFLKSQNLANIYDQIIIDTEHAPVTEEDYDNLMSTILFSESNLMEQINGNTRIIGLNRARQLEDKVNEIRANFSYTSTYNTLSTLLNFINPENLFAYWTFDYNRKNNAVNAITDISKNKRNFSSNTSLVTINRDYKGLMPFLNYSSPNYFYLDQGIQTTRFNQALFTIHGIPTVENGLLSSTSYTDYVTVKSTDIPNTSNWEMTFSFDFSDPTQVLLENDKIQNILNFSSSNVLNAYLSIQQTLDGSDITNTETTLNIQIGNGTEWIKTLSYVIIPNSSHLIKFYYFDGIYHLQEYNETTEQFEDKDTFNSNKEIYGTTGNITIGRNTLNTNLNLINSINLNEFLIKSAGNVILNGTTYENYNDVTLLDESKTSDISFTMGFVIKPVASETSRTLLARANYASNSYIFEIIEKSDNSLEIKLYSDKNNYLSFTSLAGSIPTEAHSLVFSYFYLTKNITAYINGNPLTLNKNEIGSYSHMNASPSTLYVYSCTPKYTIWANDQEAPTTLYDENGNQVQIGPDKKYNIINGKVYIDKNECSYDSLNNIQSNPYYSWQYSDSSQTYTIYTRTLDIDSTTTLYISEGVPYTGNDWSVSKNINGVYVVTYLNNEAEHKGIDLDQTTYYAWSYNQPPQEILANSDTTPTLLYTPDGELYRGSQWSIKNSDIYYLDQFIATQTSSKELPYIPLTSYVIGLNGEPAQLINSKVGVIFIIKEALNETQIRTISLVLSSIMGNNPCME